MNVRLKFLFTALLSAAWATLACAQQQPVVTVDIRSISVLTGRGSVTYLNLTAGGTGYMDGASVTIAPPAGGGVQATAHAIVSTSGVVLALIIDNPGSGYTSTPVVTIGGGSGATATASLGSYFGAPFTSQNESYGPAGIQIGISAQATGTNPVNGFTYTFYVDGQTIGTLTPNPTNGTPGTLGWTPPRPGAYFITVKADDGISTPVTSLAVRYFAVGTQIVSPVDNSLVPNGSSMVIQAVATPQPLANGNNAFVKKMDFYADGTWIGSDTTYPYSIIYSPTVTPTTHTIEARASDNLDNQISPDGTAIEYLTMVMPIGTPPTCSINSPLDGSILGVPNYAADANANIPVAVDAYSPAGTISKVELYIDGVLFGTKTTYPYSFAWKPSVVGQYRFVALAYDDKQNVVASTTSSAPTSTPLPTTVTIAGGPTVVITSPVSGATVAGFSSLTVTASASNSNGTQITSVQFFDDGVFVGEATQPNTGTTSLYSRTFTVPQRKDADGNVLTSSLTVLAVDENGLSTMSVAVPIHVTDGGATPPPPVVGIAPTITLASPIAGSQLPVNTPVVFVANASDADGFVANVQFLVEGQPIATDAVYPYSTTWTPTAPGTYRIVAKVTDNVGNWVQTLPLTVTVVDPSSNPPSVSITSPADGATLTAGTATTIRANATDDVSVATVQFFVNGQPLGTPDVAYPFSAPWTPSSPGTYVLAARATDSAGNQSQPAIITVSVGGGSPPVVSLTSPSGNVSVAAGSVVNLAAVATDADGSVASVRFVANGIQIGTVSAAPYLFDWTPTGSGTYSVYAEATDNAGNVSSSSTITVTVGSNLPPTVSITAPRVGASLQVGTTVTISALASDSDGTIASVAFYVNGVRVGSDTAAPYSVTWAPTSEGSYNLKAVAIDNANTPTTSATVLVRAVLPGSSSADTVASGMYINPLTAENGQFTLVDLQGKTATLIGYVPASLTNITARTYFFTDMPVDSAGNFQLTDSTGTVIVSGQFTAAGASGTFQDGTASVAFAGANAASQPTGSAAGYYVGSVSNHPASAVVAIIGIDGGIALYGRDGAWTDSAAGAVDVDGNFTFATRARGRFSGRVNGATGLLTGTIVRGDGGGSFDFTAAQSSVASFSDGALRNISTRGPVGGGNVLVAGFVLQSSAPKHVLIRAIGPGLTAQGVSGALANPMLTLHKLGNPNVQIGTNDDWGAGDPSIPTVSSQVGAFALPAGSQDAAMYLSLDHGVYTATVSGVGGTSGVAMLELYDADTAQMFTSEKMINISSRGQVGTGDQILVAGFVVNGNAPKKVLIRGIGPAFVALGLTGTLADPMLRLNRRMADGTWSLARENDNWETGNDPALVRLATAQVGATPPLAAGSLDSALLIVLPPGIYTAELRGANGGTGVASIEVYEVQ